MKRHFLAAAAILMSVPMAYAQGDASSASSATSPVGTQTVEKAQEFLRLISEQFKFSSSVITSPEIYYLSTNIRFEPAGPCLTRITRDFEWRLSGSQSSPLMDARSNFDQFVAEWARTYNESVSTTRKRFEVVLSPEEINWSSVSSVHVSKAQQGEVGDRFISVVSQNGLYLVSPDAPTAARVKYAMEFLRSACDLSASTGF